MSAFYDPHFSDERYDDYYSVWPACILCGADAGQPCWPKCWRFRRDTPTLDWLRKWLDGNTLVDHTGAQPRPRRIVKQKDHQ